MTARLFIPARRPGAPAQPPQGPHRHRQLRVVAAREPRRLGLLRPLRGPRVLLRRHRRAQRPRRRRRHPRAATSATCRAVEPNSVALVVTSPPYFAGKAVRGEPGRERRARRLLRVPRSMLARRLRRVRARARAGRPHRRQRGQPRSPALPLAVGRRHRDPPGPRPAAAGRGRLVEGPGRRRLVRLGHRSSARPTRCCATSPSGWSSPARVASTGRSSRRARERRAGLPHESHHLQRRVHGGHHRPLGDRRPRAPPGSGTRRRSRSSCPSG